MLRKTPLLAVLGLAAAVPLSATAATAPGTLAVSATVLNVCTVAALPLAFGSFSPSGSATDSTATITVLCTTGTAYRILLGQGTYGSSVTNRKMKDTVSGDMLSYALYSNAGYSNNWGETIGTDTVAGTGTGLNVTHTVYGRIAPSQYVTPGVYTDTVAITVDY
ncbi:spore coat U domain-containing protein [Fontimonas sp. SYSU GA230001]|uniref:Csu type fimbrial protein n=1 Tax=Fontimonas sp. SYSU GA230001 TaxID=3142450 RepID=UPI0032B37754